jgi:hypothetical protein
MGNAGIGCLGNQVACSFFLTVHENKAQNNLAYNDLFHSTFI